MSITGETKLFAGIIIGTLLIVVSAVLFISKPPETLKRSDLLLSGTYTRGNKNAKALLIEFSDFQCPACKMYKPIVDSIVKKYNDKLLFGYRHFPLAQHEFGFQAAQVAEAAGEQGKFWEMYEYLFSNQESFSQDFLKASGKALNLDTVKFDSALNTEKFKVKIEKDIADGSRFGVNATPTFFLNGKKLDLIRVDDLSRLVDEEINK